MSQETLAGLVPVEPEDDEVAIFQPAPSPTEARVRAQDIAAVHMLPVQGGRWRLIVSLRTGGRYEVVNKASPAECAARFTGLHGTPMRELTPLAPHALNGVLL